MTKKVFLYRFMSWCEVVNENNEWYAVVAPDGVNTIVYKSGANVRGS